MLVAMRVQEAPRIRLSGANMQNRVGELRGRTPHREIVRTSVLSIASDFNLNLIQNDVPVTLHYKHKNNPWRTLLINRDFSSDAVPRNSDIYLSASLDSQEKVVYDIVY